MKRNTCVTKWQHRAFGRLESLSLVSVPNGSRIDMWRQSSKCRFDNRRHLSTFSRPVASAGLSVSYLEYGRGTTNERLMSIFFHGVKQPAAQRKYHASLFASLHSSPQVFANETEEERGVSPGQLFRYLKEAAEKGDKEAQFRVGCMLCLGEDAIRSNIASAPALGGEGEVDPEEEQDEAALIQLEQLDFILGDGWVVPKEKEAFEKTQITNWKQWLKREREKLKNRKPTTAPSDQKEEEDAVTVDYAEAAKWFKLSAQQNHPLAQYFLGTFHLKGLVADHNIDTALDLLNKSAQQGNSLSCYDLGQLYYEGAKVPQNPQLAREYFSKAVENGNANAMYWLGYCYHEGIDCEPDIEKTLELLEMAAQRRHPGAIFYLAMMYRTGAGVDSDVEKMMHYLKMGAEVEDSESMRCLADIYYHGDGAEVDYPLALHYYHLAGLQGDADALCCEGVMHFKGLGTEQSYTKAFYAYQAAALKDNPAACRNLSHMYRNGLGCAQSDVNADYYQNKSDEILRLQQEALQRHHHHHHHEGGCCNHDHHHHDEDNDHPHHHHHEGCTHEHEGHSCDHHHHH